jgi:hypothetical protein
MECRLKRHITNTLLGATVTAAMGESYYNLLK